MSREQSVGRTKETAFSPVRGQRNANPPLNRWLRPDSLSPTRSASSAVGQALVRSDLISRITSRIRLPSLAMLAARLVMHDTR